MNARLLPPPSAPFVSAARRIAANAWLDGCRHLARLRMPPQCAARDLRRVAIVAALDKHNGIAQGARLQYEALRRAGLDVELINGTRSLRSVSARSEHRPASTYVFHCGGPQTASLVHAVMPHAAHAYRIGYWAWELPTPPRTWEPYGGLVDEIWTPSEFSRGSLARMFSQPVRVVPHIVSAAAPRQRETGAFTVLVLADTRSSLSRKNAHGAVEAFKRAFGSTMDARLILKIQGRDEQSNALGAATSALPNVELISDFLSEAALQDLYRRSDVLLSLHRAEGFGLPMLEAMAMGLVVVATGWSGNCDFMDNASGVLVPYDLVSVDDKAGVYTDGVWAEPDLDAAASALRRLFEDRAYFNELSGAAHLAARQWAARDMRECVA